MVPDALSKQAVSLLLRVTEDDLFSRNQESAAQLSKLFPEYAQERALNIVQLVCATVPYRRLLPEFVMPLVSKAVDY